MIKKLLFSLLFISPAFVHAQIFVMNNTPLNSCSGTHQDPGGAGNYADNSNFTQTICSNAGNCVSLTFTSFAIESGFDFLEIHNGPSSSFPQVPGSPFTGSVSPGTITSSTGCLTLVFTSDFSVNDIGWTATINCGVCPPPPPPPPPYGWTQRASVPASGRHRAVAITIGNRGYAGLGHINAVTDVLYDDWWEYDPGTNSWTQKANFPPGPRMHAAAFAIGNFGYVGTGRDNSFTEQNDLYKYDPSTNSWTAMASMPCPGRRGAVAFAVNGKGYIGTGSYSTDFWEYDPLTNSWLPKAAFPGVARISSVGFSIGNKAYVGTGDVGGPTTDFYEFDPAANIWTPKATFIGPARMEAAGFSMLGHGFLGTGSDAQSGNNFQDFYEYDPVANSWVQLIDFSGTARRYMSCFVLGTRGYGVFGTSGTNYNDLWEYGNLDGINEVSEKELHIKTYPNPFSDKITFFIPQNETIGKDAELKIWNVSGQLQAMINVTEHETILNKGELNSGIYFYELISGNTIKATGKFIAE